MKSNLNSEPVKITLRYPQSDEYEYFTKLIRINLDEFREKMIKEGKGFIISEPAGIKKDIKLQGGIFSSRYGSNSMADADSFGGRFSCKCGDKRGSIRNGEFCEICKTRVKYVSDDVSITGFLKLKDYYWIIHPTYYRTLAAFIGVERLNRIILPDIKIDIDGNELPVEPKQKNEPFAGIGILQFHDRYEEVLNFYLSKSPMKRIYYDDLLANKNNVWTHTIAVFSSLLRPSYLDNGSLKYEACNDHFNILAKLVYQCNNDVLSIDRKSKERLALLYDIQYNLNNLYIECRDIMAKKKGDIRAAIGGRYCFSARAVIKQDVTLKADEIKLPFMALCILLEQVIVNILKRSYHFGYADAYKKWKRCIITGYDQVIYDILDGLIKNEDHGLPVIINRNPTIAYGGILSVKCIGINMDYTMSISILVLQSMGADFDGDTLNIWYLYMKQLIEVADKVLNPKYMMISNNDGQCNTQFMHYKDYTINANALKMLYEYRPDQIEKIKRLQRME